MRAYLGTQYNVMYNVYAFVIDSNDQKRGIRRSGYFNGQSKPSHIYFGSPFTFMFLTGSLLKQVTLARYL